MIWIKSDYPIISNYYSDRIARNIISWQSNFKWYAQNWMNEFSEYLSGKDQYNELNKIYYYIAIGN